MLVVVMLNHRISRPCLLLREFACIEWTSTGTCCWLELYEAQRAGEFRCKRQSEEACLAARSLRLDSCPAMDAQPQESWLPTYGYKVWVQVVRMIISQPLPGFLQPAPG